ncbi:2-amino-4-hydroxy-6-hydroxymethyldihydropteridine diphosphokinase [Anderseniella sp. Alg231-50]|uniref:2-amino-4-hydroxy-6- hydroxymethyldihydropteridine diphosphokinase n=1 Tax=Anderseniella sp. Alg231-50 TaxID=1922226 RepID=UPI000D55E8A9
MILIGLGSNMTGPWGSPRDCVGKALAALGKQPLNLLKASTLIGTTPFGNQDQPSYINAVARIETRLPALGLLQVLRTIEHTAGRERRERWGERTLDLDILDYNGVVLEEGVEQSTDAELVLPHPAIAEREFVLTPIAEIAPRWKHPVTGLTARAMLAELDTDKGGNVIDSGSVS